MSVDHKLKSKSGYIEICITYMKGSALHSQSSSCVGCILLVKGVVKLKPLGGHYSGIKGLGHCYLVGMWEIHVVMIWCIYVAV